MGNPYLEYIKNIEDELIYYNKNRYKRKDVISNSRNDIIIEICNKYVPIEISKLITEYDYILNGIIDTIINDENIERIISLSDDGLIFESLIGPGPPSSNISVRNYHGKRIFDIFKVRPILKTIKSLNNNRFFIIYQYLNKFKLEIYNSNSKKKITSLTNITLTTDLFQQYIIHDSEYFNNENLSNINLNNSDLHNSDLDNSDSSDLDNSDSSNLDNSDSNHNNINININLYNSDSNHNGVDINLDNRDSYHNNVDINLNNQTNINLNNTKLNNVMKNNAKNNEVNEYVLKFICAKENEICIFIYHNNIWSNDIYHIDGLNPIKLFVISENNFIVINKNNDIYIFDHNIKYKIYNFEKEIIKIEVKKNSNEIIIHSKFLNTHYITLFDYITHKIIKKIETDHYIYHIIISETYIILFGKHIEIRDNQFKIQEYKSDKKEIYKSPVLLPDGNIAYIKQEKSKYTISILNCITKIDSEFKFIQNDDILKSLLFLNDNRLLCLYERNIESIYFDSYILIYK